MKLRMFSVVVTFAALFMVLFYNEGAAGIPAGIIFVLESAAAVGQITVLLKSVNTAPFSESQEKRVYLSVCSIPYIIVAAICPVTELTKLAVPAILAAYIITSLVLIRHNKKDKADYYILVLCAALFILYLAGKTPL